MKTGWAIAFGLLGGLLAAAVILLASSPPQGEPVKLLPPPTARMILAHVTGAVVNPGVYSLPVDSRVQDAFQAAGGLLPAANANSLNLAALVKDGERIWVPYQTQDNFQPARQAADSNGEQKNPGSQGLVNINTASQIELESLPGIGPVTAQKIIAHREAHGLFTDIEDIMDVSGIGPVTFENIKDLIGVGSP